MKSFILVKGTGAVTFQVSEKDKVRVTEVNEAEGFSDWQFMPKEEARQMYRSLLAEGWVVKT